MRRTLRSSQPNHPIHDASSLLNSPKWADVAKELKLTPRQADVVRLVLQAKHNKEIAALLGMRICTVRMHLRYVYTQLGISDRMELALHIFPRLCE